MQRFFEYLRFVLPLNGGLFDDNGPEPSGREMVDKSHDFIATYSDVPLRFTVSSASKRKRSAPVTPKPCEKKKRSENVDEDQDSQLNSQTSSHRAPFGTLLYSM